jgi:hypothetical protein
MVGSGLAQRDSAKFNARWNSTHALLIADVLDLANAESRTSLSAADFGTEYPPLSDGRQVERLDARRTLCSYSQFFC